METSRIGNRLAQLMVASCSGESSVLSVQVLIQGVIDV